MTLCPGVTWMTSQDPSPPLLPALTPRLNPCYLTPLQSSRGTTTRKLISSSERGRPSAPCTARRVCCTKVFYPALYVKIYISSGKIRSVITCEDLSPSPSSPARPSPWSGCLPTTPSNQSCTQPFTTFVSESCTIKNFTEKD